MKYRLLSLILLLCLPAAVAAQRYARVVSDNANLRDTPSITGESALEIPEETLVKVLDEKLPWYVVRVGNRVGWMHGNTLEFISTSGAPTSEQSSEQSITPDYTPTPPVRPVREDTTSPPSGGSTPRSSTAHPGYIRGPRGGCYYISPSGRKVYVDRSLCN